MRVAVVQAEPKWQLRAGIEHIVELMGAAAAAGAELIAFPEAFVPGYPWWVSPDGRGAAESVAHYRSNAMTRDGAEMRAVLDAAREYRIHVVFGFVERCDRRVFMTQAVIDDTGTVLSLRRKPGLNSQERRVFSAGTPGLPTVHRSRIGRLGALSGQENSRPLFTRAMRADGQQIHVAAWPGFLTAGDTAGIGAPTTASRLYAIEGGAFVLAPCAVVGSAGLSVPGVNARLARGGGYARIFGSDGAELATPLAEDEEGFLYADLNLGVGRVDPPLRDLLGAPPVVAPDAPAATRRRGSRDTAAAPGAERIRLVGRESA
ncbi:Aliphatic nitrilase [Nocardia otitidiscaviarum]|uniref:Aliphatic nitrilase n=1 Tax=Nocardia otitidiscaviarum TaxID=1823 RepID=A0A378YJM9_9NOCA|nr:nitrilase-related carbon-nitrogen hydrolase [Nocardia otitidiscaviarum]MBF6179668.1 carbon-nitrogen hydrolase family protein [Nocardia otitidiscaviarum]MCP9620966.1 carbon-nitrogen hydrolase family protein [Nocardia otitidiscaviarum]QDP81733.1 carbon-nitrogen hydrolase family protein [Nocardia otitidiscaviarum]SUA76750.1 Aliphatic nitrilase [Nocardia otitidiscaviarum]